MGFFAALGTISASGPLASRAFLPLFLVSLWAAFPGMAEALPLVDPLVLPPGMEWLGQQWFVVVAGVLAALEIAADKNPELQELLDEGMVYAKTAVAFLIAMAVLPDDVRGLLPQATGATKAGFGVELPIALATAASTWYLAGSRVALMDFIRTVDDGDGFGARLMVSLLEDTWALVGFVVFIFMPLVALVLALILFSVVWLCRSLLDKWANRKRQPCPHCQTPIMPTAQACSKCHEPVTPGETLSWGWFNNREANAAPLTGISRDDHMLRLLATRRCPQCAELCRPANLLKAPCEHCGFRLSETTLPGWRERYMDHVRKRAWALFIPICLLGLVPMLGPVIALVLIRFQLVAPWRVLLTLPRRFLTRWVLRALTFLLFIPGCIPALSILAVPLLLVLNIVVYNKAAKGQTDAYTGTQAPATTSTGLA